MLGTKPPSAEQRLHQQLGSKMEQKPESDEVEVESAAGAGPRPEPAPEAKAVESESQKPGVVQEFRAVGISKIM